MIRYYIVPGYIRSKYDKDIHYIDSATLIRLYDVSRSECLILDESSEYHRRLIDTAHMKGIKVLKPNYNGDYNVK